MTKHLENNIFVIYSIRDEYVNENSLNKICNELKVYGNVFIDLIHNNSINKQEYVLQKLNESSSIVIINSSKINESKWAQLEIKIAKEQNKQILGYYEPIFINNNYELVFKQITNSNSSLLSDNSPFGRQKE